MKWKKEPTEKQVELYLRLIETPHSSSGYLSKEENSFRELDRDDASEEIAKLIKDKKDNRGHSDEYDYEFEMPH